MFMFMFMSMFMFIALCIRFLLRPPSNEANCVPLVTCSKFETSSRIGIHSAVRFCLWSITCICATRRTGIEQQFALERLPPCLFFINLHLLSVLIYIYIYIYLFSSFYLVRNIDPEDDLNIFYASRSVWAQSQTPDGSSFTGRWYWWWKSYI